MKTGDIGKFVIIGQRPRTAGVRRLYALTSHVAVESIRSADKLHHEMCRVLNENDYNFISTRQFVKVSFL